ncbi:MAG: DUF1232 domain-containing protein [Alphaproteobacteria bacterium]|nr:DUF1232 domain-containing protein [Alphaproteobacteria bacterium]
MSANLPVQVDKKRLEEDEGTVRRGFWRKVRATLGRAPFIFDALAAFHAATDPLTPLHVKAVLLGALAYFVLPIDAIPDFIAGLGYTDDAAVLLAAIKTVSGHITGEHRARAAAFLSEADPQDRNSG